MQPIVTLTEQYDSNIDLDPSSQRGNYSYIGDAATLFGFATPNSDTSIKPDVRYANYPNESALNRLEGTLDFNTGYSSPRAKFHIYARYDHLNDEQAETPSAVYNDVVPGSPLLTQIGVINVNVTRNNVWTQPSFTWRLSPILDVGVSGVFQSQNFSPADQFSHVDYNYYQGAVTFGGNLNPRTAFELDGIAARYQAKNINSTANSTGGSAELDFNLTAVASVGVSAQYQHSQIDALQPVRFVGPANTWGAAVNAQWHSQISQIRFNAGRIITPSSGGSLYVSEQARAEYDRDLSERLSFTGALLYVRSISLAGIGSGFDTDYRRADVSLKWMLTEKWFIQGGYGYLWDKWTTYLPGALDNVAYLRFGYQGLPRRY